jgi:hypothetical protein
VATPPIPTAALPYRGTFGDSRPPSLDALALPPGPMPGHDRLRPLKAWRYVGVFGPQLMLCAAAVRIGPARQSFWAVWDRERQTLRERTAIGRGRVRLSPGRVQVTDGDVAIDLELAEVAGIETVCASGAGYAWTRKQGGIEARGWVTIDGQRRALAARGVIDDSAGYHARHTSWRWSAGVGEAHDGAPLAWNLVQGVNDPDCDSERTVWIDGQAGEVEPVRFDPALEHVGGLRFTAEATWRQRQNLLLVRSVYRQPFGTFSGELPGGRAVLAEGFGVMEEHDAWW